MAGYSPFSLGRARRRNDEGSVCGSPPGPVLFLFFPCRRRPAGQGYPLDKALCRHKSHVTDAGAAVPRRGRGACVIRAVAVCTADPCIEPGSTPPCRLGAAHGRCRRSTRRAPTARDGTALERHRARAGGCGVMMPKVGDVRARAVEERNQMRLVRGAPRRTRTTDRSLLAYCGDGPSVRRRGDGPMRSEKVKKPITPAPLVLANLPVVDHGTGSPKSSTTVQGFLDNL